MCYQIKTQLQNTVTTPEELMRSRYAAFERKDFAYLALTETNPEPMDEATQAWLRGLIWCRLEIVSAQGHQVEFKAYHLEQGVPYCLHERSEFVQNAQGQWLYDKGEVNRYKMNLGRNDSCLCDSGKKFKKCCGL
ncbi:SecC motif-containing protein [Thiomicrospira cyclica ALM1]|uniref:SecC motif-containing protein n=1 Tax=Thiomicrospira cyclica (strain DSM 14477 / JCM 11371 / ALM1) TaxID=717773 RepID=F6DCG2_THICA|nr:SecC motif-containing protein [Thiomicrospira cyclica ALM1]